MKTLVLGASLKPERYSNIAIHRLRKHKQDVVAVGLREGKVGDVNIKTGTLAIEQVHTITLYLNAKRQEQYYDYIFSLDPKRIIFNPGAENQKLYQMAEKKGIMVENACTLVMLNLGIYQG